MNRVSTIRFVRGSHGAGNSEAFWDPIAKFVLGDYRAATESVPPGSIASKRLSLPGTLWTAGLWLLSWLNILIWVVIAAAVLIGAPLIINSLSNHIPSALQWLKDVPSDPARAASAMAIGFFLYLRLALSQRQYCRRFWIVRNFVTFPLALAASILALWYLSHAGAAALAAVGIPVPLTNGDELFALANSWSSAAIVLWFVFVLWALRRI